MLKKSSTFVPDLSKMTIFTPRTYVPIFEISSPVPTAEVVPKEALSIREMLVRTDRGQRLNVHTRMRTENMPDNMYPEGEIDGLHESINDAPPDGIVDRVDVEAYQADLELRKRALESKRKQKRGERSTDGNPNDKPKDPKEGPAEKSEAASEAEQ